jgi:hypothetical protein
MKLSRVTSGALLACVVLFPTASKAQLVTWDEFSSTNVASAVGVDWVIGQNDGGQIFELTVNGFMPIANSFATTISMDRTGSPWAVNSQGVMFFWNGSTFKVFDPSDNSHKWASVAVGDPTHAGDIWAIDTSGAIYANGGTETQPGLWIQIPGSFGTKIAMFGATTSCKTEGTIHVPWVINAKNQIFQYQVNANNDCLTGGFIQFTTNGAAAKDITSDFVLGTDGNVYQFTNGAFQFFANPPAGGLTSIASFNDDMPWALGPNGNIFRAD